MACPRHNDGMMPKKEVVIPCQQRLLPVWQAAIDRREIFGRETRNSSGRRRPVDGLTAVAKIIPRHPPRLGDQAGDDPHARSKHLTESSQVEIHLDSSSVNAHDGIAVESSRNSAISHLFGSHPSIRRPEVATGSGSKASRGSSRKPGTIQVAVMNTRSRTWGRPPTKVPWKQMRRKNRGTLRHVVTLSAEGFDDDFPFVAMLGTDQVPDILQDDDLGVVRLDDLQDVPVKCPAGLFHPLLGARLRKGLAGESRCKNVVRSNGHHVVVGVSGDVAKRIMTPVLLVDLRGLRIDLDRVGALPTESRKRGVEPTHSGEQVSEAKGRLSYA